MLVLVLVLMFIPNPNHPHPHSYSYPSLSPFQALIDLSSILFLFYFLEQPINACLPACLHRYP